MQRTRQHHANRVLAEPLARIVKRRLVTAIASIAGLFLALLLGVYQENWADRLSIHRTLIMGTLGLGLLFLIFAFPLLVENVTHPRPLSGPGDLPSSHGGPQRG